MSLASALENAKSRLKPTTTVVRPHPCIATGVEQFGKNFLGDVEASKEFDEPEEATIAAAQAAASLIRSASYVVVHTGAGIATAAGVGDFRGKCGVWTQLSKGIIPDDSFDITECVPSRAHMAVKGLVDAGIVKDVVSTNHDGLHMKSGLNVGEQLHELHGNVYVERCVRCFTEYRRSYPVLRTADRYTGRHCECGGSLWDSGVDFGQTLPQRQLSAAERASKKADVHLVLGSSLQVAPSSLLPRQYGGKLILVNKGKTPADGPAGRVAVRSHGLIDRFMIALAQALDVEIPQTPTLEETGYLSIKMLLARRWTLREERLRSLEGGEPREEDKTVPPGWSRHVDVKSAGIDYWFHLPSNKISFGRPVETEDDVGSSLDAREARAIQAERAYAAAAPTFAEARANLQASKISQQGPLPLEGAERPACPCGAANAVEGPSGSRRGNPPGPPPSKGAGKSAGSGLAAGRGKRPSQGGKGSPPGPPPPKGAGKSAGSGRAACEENGPSDVGKGSPPGSSHHGGFGELA